MSSIISPELALIDSDLAKTARAALPEPMAADPRSMRHVPRSEGTRPDRRAQARSFHIRKRALVVAAMVVMFLGATRVGPGSHPAHHAPHVFSWRAVAAAELYRIDVKRNGRPILMLTTPSTKAELPRSVRLAPGSYTWEVHAVDHRGKSPSQQGSAIAHGRFTA